MASARENQMLAPGEPAPDFQLDDLNGARQTLGALIEKPPVFLAFFKVSCPTCQLTLPFLERLYQALRSGRPRILAVSQDDAEATREFHREFSITMPTLLDSARQGYPASNAYGLSHVPSMFLIEQDRRISWSLSGFHKKELESLAAKFNVPVFHPGERVPEMKSG
jgi:peroxiredoxin